MLSKKILISLLLTITLLVAPATLAAPAADAQVGWLSSITALLADILGFFGVEKASTSADGTSKDKPQVSNLCGGEGGAYPEPNGCV